ncbi:MAG: hypothetical protein ACI9GK_003316, partial [Devosia sp.]
AFVKTGRLIRSPATWQCHNGPLQWGYEIS